MFLPEYYIGCRYLLLLICYFFETILSYLRDVCCYTMHVLAIKNSELSSLLFKIVL